LVRAATSVAVGGEIGKRVSRRWEGRVTFDDGATFPDRDYLAIGAGTVDQIGLGFRPFYRYAEAEDHFHILGIHTSSMGFVRVLPDIWRACPMGEMHTFECVTRSAVLEARGGVVHYILDGDVHSHEGPLSARIGPVVKILVEHKTGIRPSRDARPAGETSGGRDARPAPGAPLAH